MRSNPSSALWPSFSGIPFFLEPSTAKGKRRKGADWEGPSFGSCRPLRPPPAAQLRTLPPLLVRFQLYNSGLGPSSFLLRHKSNEGSVHVRSWPTAQGRQQRRDFLSFAISVHTSRKFLIPQLVARVGLFVLFFFGWPRR